MKLVSIIVPCYNQALYLNECLQSVLNQSYTNWECIIINDGSEDETTSIATSWCEKDNRFIYIEQENKGVSIARNNAITKSKGTYILPLDADDYISKNYLEFCTKEIEKNKNIELVYGNCIKFGEEQGEWNLPSYSYERLLQYNMIFCTSLFKRSSFDKVGGYDEKMVNGLEDWEFWIRLLKHRGEVVNIKECDFYYRIKEVSRNTNLYKDTEKVNLSYNYIFNKHMDVYKEPNSIELYKKYRSNNEYINNLHKHLSLTTLIQLFLKKVGSIFSR